MDEQLGPGTTEKQIQVVEGLGHSNPGQADCESHAPTAQPQQCFTEKNNGKTGYNQGTLFHLNWLVGT